MKRLHVPKGDRDYLAKQAEEVAKVQKAAEIAQMQFQGALAMVASRVGVPQGAQYNFAGGYFEFEPDKATAKS